MASLEDLAGKGVDKYRGKISQMETNYSNAKDKAKKNYEAQPFGPTVTGNYKNAWDKYMVSDYQNAMKPEKADTWKERWMAAMRK